MSKSGNAGPGGKHNHGGGGKPNQSAGDGYPLGKGALGPTPSALEGQTQKEIARQARKTVRSAYKPTLKDISQQEKDANAFSQKRAIDNKYYLDWLNTQSAQLDAHAAAADATVRDQQAAIQGNAEQAMLAMRQQLMDQGNATAGNVSNEAEANAFNVTPEAVHAIGGLVNERALSEKMMGTNAQQQGIADKSNFALIAGSEANRQADLMQKLSDLGDERTKARLEQAGAQQAEVARLLTQEIDKAKAKVDMRNMAASQALANRAQNLEQKKYRFDVRSTFRDQQATNEDTRHDNHAQDAAQAETERHNQATEALTKKGIVADQQKAADASAADAKKQSQETTANIESGITYIKTAKGLKGESVRSLTQKLTNHGMDPLLASAAAQLATDGKLSPATIQKLKSIGYVIPPNYLK